MLLHGGTNNSPQFEDLKRPPMLDYRKQPESNMNPISGYRPDTLEGWVTHLKTQTRYSQTRYSALGFRVPLNKTIPGFKQFTV